MPGNEKVLELAHHAVRYLVPAGLDAVGLCARAAQLRGMPKVSLANAAYARDVIHCAFVDARRAAHGAAARGDPDAASNYAWAACAAHAAADACGALAAASQVMRPGFFLAAALAAARACEDHAHRVVGVVESALD